MHCHEIPEGALTVKNDENFGFSRVGRRQLGFKCVQSDAGCFDFFPKITPSVRHHGVLKFTHFVETTQCHFGQLNSSFTVERLDRSIGGGLFFPD